MLRDKLKVVAAEDHHLVHVSRNLRKQDMAETLANGLPDALPSLRLAMQVGRTWAVIGPSGNACAVGGVVPSEDPEAGAVWLLATNELVQNRREFVRRSRAYVDALHDLYPLLFNFAHSKNRIHLRWLKWAGFVFINEVPSGVGNGETFYEFVRIRT